MKIETEPLQPPYHLTIGVISEKGVARNINQDAYLIDKQRGLFLLADGMGGYQAGEVASRVALNVIYETLTTASSMALKETLGMSLLAAHQAIRTMAAEEDAYRGMGTTALIAWVRIPELILWTAHVGNSRAYLWRKGVLQQLTEDHTLLNELRKANFLPKDPKNWPSPVVLSQALGSRQPVLAPGFGEWILQPGDRLLFCSDGISDVLTNVEINNFLSTDTLPQVVCEQLGNAVRQRGAQDDFTAILVNVEENPEKQAVQTVQVMEVEK